MALNLNNAIINPRRVSEMLEHALDSVISTPNTIAVVRDYGRTDNITATSTMTLCRRMPADYDAVRITLHGATSGANAFKAAVAPSSQFNNGWEPKDAAGSLQAFTALSWGTTSRGNPRNPSGGAATTTVTGTSGTTAAKTLIEGDIPSDILQINSLTRTDVTGAPPLLYVRLQGVNLPAFQAAETSSISTNPWSGVETDFYSGYWSAADHVPTSDVNLINPEGYSTQYRISAGSLGNLVALDGNPQVASEAVPCTAGAYYSYGGAIASTTGGAVDIVGFYASANATTAIGYSTASAFAGTGGAVLTAITGGYRFIVPTGATHFRVQLNANAITHIPTGTTVAYAGQVIPTVTNPSVAPTQGWAPSITIECWLRGKKIYNVGVTGDSIDHGAIPAGAVPQFGGNINGWGRRFVKLLNDNGILSSYVALCHSGDPSSQYLERSMGAVLTGRLTHLFIKPWSLNETAAGIAGAQRAVARTNLLLQVCRDRGVQPILFIPWGGQGDGTVMKTYVLEYVEACKAIGIPVFDARSVTDNAAGNLKVEFQNVDSNGVVVDVSHMNDLGQATVAQEAFKNKATFYLE